MQDRAFYGTTAGLTATMSAAQLVQPANTIELQVERVALLFDPLDPFPLPARDVAKPVETFILDAARELRDAPIHIVIRLPDREAHGPEGLQIKAAIAAYFSRGAESITRDLRELFRIGRLSLLIGLCALAACTVGANAISDMYDSSIAGFASEGLIILGWVANWRPIEIFLYEWWPLVRLRRLHRRIAAASLEIRPNWGGGRA